MKALRFLTLLLLFPFYLFGQQNTNSVESYFDVSLEELLNVAIRVQIEWSKGVPRPDIRRTILTAVSEHPPATQGKRELKIYSAMQDGTMPPSFTFFVNHSDMIHFSYRRYLENRLREEYKFEGSPLRMRFRGWKG